mmetsp:Transcript_3069/g.7246  ORF Transcript_3069/g.7246 Transcript_3069/m.7246 type:complete len:598 (-) Transcript_3069:184-1977(-)
MRSSSTLCSLGTLARIIMLVCIVCGMASFRLMHSAALNSLVGEDHMRKDDFNEGRPSRQDETERKQEAAISELQEKIERLEYEKNTLLKTYQTEMSGLASKIEGMESTTNKKDEVKVGDGEEIQELRLKVENDRKDLEKTMEVLQHLKDDARDHFKDTSTNMADVVDFISGLRGKKTDTPSKQLKVHIWDDSTHYKPREEILVAEGWLEYNGKALGDPDDSSTKPMFELTEDPADADLIVWPTVMGRHELEIAPMHPVKHAHKVIVLDYADGGTIHRKREEMQSYHTELGYFKRSFILHGKNNSFKGNITDTIFPYAYSGVKDMMIAPDIPQADPNHQPVLGEEASVYGKVATTSSNEKKDDGYFKDQRYQNFLVPYRDRKWNLVNVIRFSPQGPNKDRNRIVEWTREFSRKKGGDPRTGKDFMEEMKSSPPDKPTAEVANGFTAYVGEILNFCSGHCFGPNYFRHLRDSKIVVTCNPSKWEGDFRLWEAFLSGALVMVDRMWILDFMPNPPIHGKHWVTYDPGNKTDFMTKLSYYSDPANIDEAEAIAKRGYEFVLRHHMAVNRVEYLLNHEKVRNGLMEHVRDPSKRKLFGYPPL